MEHALEPAYARALGVDMDNLLIAQPDTGEQALEITDALVRSGALDVVVVDSVAALLPAANWKGKWATPAWASWPPHVPGPAETGGQRFQIQLYRGVYKPAPGKDRRHVRQPETTPAAGR